MNRWRFVKVYGLIDSYSSIIDTWNFKYSWIFLDSLIYVSLENYDSLKFYKSLEIRFAIQTDELG